MKYLQIHPSSPKALSSPSSNNSPLTSLPIPHSNSSLIFFQLSSFFNVPYQFFIIHSNHTHIHTHTHTHRFLDEGLVALDITDPVTNEHLHSIVSKLCSNLESCIKNNSKPDLQQTMSHLLKRAKFTLRSHASSRNAEVSNMTF